MKFKDKYPHMKPIVDEAPNGVIRGYDALPCAICNEDTEYVDINFECHICSDECQEKMDRDYIDACLKHMDDNGVMAEFGMAPSC